MEKEEKLILGKIYYDSKNQPYQIITIAKQIETGENLLIYQELFHDFSIYASSISFFLKKIQTLDNMEEIQKQKKEFPIKSQETMIKENTNLLYQFLDAPTNEEKLNILLEMRDHIDDNILTSIALSLDIIAEEGTLENRYESILNCLRTLIQYEGRRLR